MPSQRSAGPFAKSVKNGWNGDNDGRFLLDMFNRRGDMTERQRMKASTIIRNAVYPWLRKVWRDAHDQQDPGF
jgi:hypothetical protein